MSGIVIERGTVDSVEYRVWRYPRTGKVLVYVGHAKGGKGSRRNFKWLLKMRARGLVIVDEGLKQST